ncbi:MAG: hypothetical protein Q4G43_10930 [Mobilicoccus sp.]|nr:hypothetical protein [Mobilicoccus sp.]
MTASRRDTRRSFSSLDHPAFGDEREQRTWAEAYVLAYEVAQLAAVTVAAAMVWIGGGPLMWWSLAVIWIIGLGNWAALFHLRRAGLTDLPWRDRLRFWTFRVRLLLIAVWAIGFASALGNGHAGPGTPHVATIAGMITGATTVIVVLALIDRRIRARASRTGEDDEFDR